MTEKPVYHTHQMLDGGEIQQPSLIKIREAFTDLLNHAAECEILCFAGSRQYAEALALLDEFIAERGWQPIETAPRDGDAFLVCLPGQQNLILRARFCKVHKYFTTDRMSEGITQPSFFHDGDMWMPLPTPPANCTTL